MIAAQLISQSVELPKKKQYINYQLKEDVDYFVDKEINYETNAPSSTFVKKVLLVSSDDLTIYNLTSEAIRTYSYINQPTFLKAYGTEGATNTDVNNHINNGLGIVNYRGHGEPAGWDEWSGSSTYATSHAYLLNNQIWNPVVFSVACQTAHMYNNDETLAEAFVKTTYGASAYLGACEDVNNTMNNTFDKLLFKTVYDNNVYNIGNVLLQVINNPELNDIYEHRFYYLWLGEPSLELWTDTPQQFTNLTVTDNGSSLIINTGVSGSDICVSSTNSGSSYYSVIHNTSSYTFNTSVRPLYITVTKHNYVPYTAITGGTISTDEYWMGNLKILGSLVLSSGKTLKIGNGSPQVQGSFTIQQGAQLFFRKGSSLIVNGSLNAQGILTNKITFDLFDDPIDQSDKWSGIVFNSGSSGIIEYCNVKNATTGITCYSSLSNIRYNTISNNSTGISVYNIGTPTNEISFNTIQNNSSRGINLSYASPKIYSNTINNSYCGIYCYYSSPYLYGNTIYGQSTGVNCTSYSSAYFVPWNAYGYYWGRGYNIIRDNTSYEISASYWSNLYLGSSPYGGYNSIYDNTSSYEMYAAYNCNIMAEINWWGTNPHFYTYQSTFDYDPQLQSPPSGAQNINPGNNNFAKLSNSGSELDKAYQLQLCGKFDEAILIYNSFIKENPEDTKAAYALVRIDECYKLSGKKEFINYFNNEIRNKTLVNSDLDAVSLELKNLCLVEEQNYHEAVINFNLLAEKYKENPFMEKYSLFNAGFIYLKYLNDYKSAGEKFNELSVKYPNDVLVEEIKYLLGEDESTRDEGSPQPKLSSTKLIQCLSYELKQNYPNPFNPSTSINFSIAKEGLYSLKIFNILGQEVKTLFDEYLNPGSYDIEFNAGTLSSGVYIYQLSGNKVTLSKKLMLMR